MNRVYWILLNLCLEWLLVHCLYKEDYLQISNACPSDCTTVATNGNFWVCKMVNYTN